MKELSQAKMRLADVLDRGERAELALAMLTDVISACEASRCFDAICVVSGDREVLSYASDLGARPLAEPTEARWSSGVQALNAGLAFALRQLAENDRADEVVIVPADIPLLQPTDIRAVVDALTSGDGSRVVMAPSADNGTNALALRPPQLIPMRFGSNSADAHRLAAIGAGVEPVVLDLPRLRFDVDSPDDLRALESSDAGAATRGWLDARAHQHARGGAAR